jgi:hypothetical protein
MTTRICANILALATASSSPNSTAGQGGAYCLLTDASRRDVGSRICHCSHCSLMSTANTTVNTPNPAAISQPIKMLDGANRGTADHCFVHLPTGTALPTSSYRSSCRGWVTVQRMRDGADWQYAKCCVNLRILYGQNELYTICAIPPVDLSR